MHRAGEMAEFSKACSWEAEKKFHLPLLEYHYKVHDLDTLLCSCRMSEKVLVVCGNSRGATALFLRPWSHKSHSMGTSTHHRYELSAWLLLKTGKPFFIEKVIWMIFSLTQVRPFYRPFLVLYLPGTKSELLESSRNTQSQQWGIILIFFFNGAVIVNSLLTDVVFIPYVLSQLEHYVGCTHTIESEGVNRGKAWSRNTKEGDW